MSKILKAMQQTKQDMKDLKMLKDNNDGTFSIKAPCSFEKPSRKEALKLADELDEASKLESDLNRPENEADFQKASAMIRRLVEELDEKNYRILELTKRYKALTWNDKQTKCPDCGEVNPAEIHTCSPQTKPLSDEEIADGISDIIDAVGLNDDCMNEEWIKSGVDKFRSLFTTVSPQTKPLSDEEIDTIITNCGYQIEETVLGKFVDIEGINMYNIFKGFTKAIEEMHGIK